MRFIFFATILFYSPTILSQKKEFIIADTLENSNVLVIYGFYEDEVLKNEYHYLFNQKGKRLYYREYSYSFNDYIGAKTFTITKEKITRRGKKIGIKNIKLKSGHCKPTTHSDEYLFENFDTKKEDSGSESRLMYSVNSDSLKWATWKDSIIYEPISKTYKFDSILIYKRFLNNELQEISYSYPFSCEVIKSIELDSNNNFEAMIINKFSRDKTFIKKEYQYYFDYKLNELRICKLKFNLHRYTKHDCKTTPIKSN